MIVSAFGPAAAADNAPGWSIFAKSETVFVGDPINITIKGPELNFSIRVSMFEPNGTLMSTYFPIFHHGLGFYNYSLKISDPPGTYRFVVLVGDNTVAGIAVVVLYDELNFLSKRTTLLEKQNDQQGKLISNLISDNKRLHSQIDFALLVVPVTIGIVVCVTLISLFVTTAPSWRFLQLLKWDSQPMNGLVDRFLTWLVAPYAVGELRQYHLHRKLIRPPEWSLRCMAARVDALNASPYSSPGIRRKMRPIRVVRSADKAGGGK